MNNKELLLPFSERNTLIPLSIANNSNYDETILFAQRLANRRDRLRKRLERGFNSKNSHREIICIDIINSLEIELGVLTTTMKYVHEFNKSQKNR